MNHHLLPVWLVMPHHKPIREQRSFRRQSTQAGEVWVAELTPNVPKRPIQSTWIIGLGRAGFADNILCSTP